MADLILSKIDGVSTEIEHERINKIVSLASLEADIKRLEVESGAI